MLRPLFNLAAGLLLFPQSRAVKNTPSEIQVEIPATSPLLEFHWKPSPQLPKGCEDYRLITGDLNDARIFLLGDHRGKCKQARERCSQGLLKQRMPEGIDPDKTTLLFDHCSGDEPIICTDIGESFAKLSNDCRGWNLSNKERKHEWLPVKVELLKIIATQLEQWRHISANETASEWRQATADGVKAWTDEMTTRCSDIDKELTAPIEKNGARSPAPKQRLLTAELQKYRFAEKYLKQIHNEIIAGKELRSIVADINKKINRFTTLAAAYWKDQERSIRKPNDAMIKAIRETSRKKITLAYASRTNIDPTFLVEKEKEAAKRQMIISQLYGDLIHINPFAVLACRVTKEDQ